MFPRRFPIWGIAMLTLMCCYCQDISEYEKEDRNLILGTQKGLLPHEVRVFLASLRSTGSRAKVIIFSADESRLDLEEVASIFDAELVYYNFSEYAKYGPMNLHRFQLFRQALDSAESEYDQVLMCDIRDVLFQSDPFEALSVEDGIGVALEPAHLPIGDCDIHVSWLTQECPTYMAEGVAERIGRSSRSCAGTTIGTHRGVRAYLAAMEAEAARTVWAAPAGAGAARFEGRSTTFDGERWWAWCNDQAMHNALLWTGRLALQVNVTLYDAETSPLATVGTMRPIHLTAAAAHGEEDADADGGGDSDADGGGGGGCEGGRPAALVHQYDRVAPLVRNAQSMYGLEGEVFQTFFERWGPADPAPPPAAANSEAATPAGRR